MNHYRNLTALLLFASAAGLSAQTLAEKEAWATEQEAIDKSIASVQQACGTKVALNLDKPAWWKVRNNWANGSPAGRCGVVYDALHQVCQSTDGKKAVAAKIKTVQCGYGGTNSGRKLELKGSTIHYQVQLDTPNEGENIVKFLKERI